MFRKDVDYFAHANTTIGIEATRDFVRSTAEEWGVALIEREPPRLEDRYRALVLDQGFPGPAMHFKMFTRLKERALEQIQRELVSDPRKERVVFIAGRRNRASDLIHMSGECLCGAFAAPGERAEIDAWFPTALDEVRELEALIADREDIPEHRKTWGWGSDPAKKALDGKASRSGLLCSSCDDRFQMTLDGVA
jgi:hypothetical protein